MPSFRKLIEQTQAVESDVPRLRDMLSRAEALANSEQVTKELQDLLDEQHQRRLQIGAAGQLLMNGELAEIVPLDDDATHRAANPLRDGRVVQSEKAIAAREEAMVARLLASDEPVTVIVLGAGHDLGSLLGRRGVDYRRVVPGRVEQLLEGLE